MTKQVINEVPIPKRGQRAALWIDLFNPFVGFEANLIELPDALLAGREEEPDDDGAGALWSLVCECDEFKRTYRSYDPNTDVLVVSGSDDHWDFWTIERPDESV